MKSSWFLMKITSLNPVENSVLRKLVSEIGDTSCEDISLFCVVQSLINIETWLFKEN